MFRTCSSLRPELRTSSIESLAVIGKVVGNAGARGTATDAGYCHAPISAFAPEGGILMPNRAIPILTSFMLAATAWPAEALLIERISVTSGGTHGNGLSSAPVLSSDGRFVAFYSEASNLVVGDTNGAPDAFVHDR